MVFNSVIFAVFLAVILTVYWNAPPRWQNPILLAGSYLFYGWWDWRFLSLLAIATLVNFAIGLLLSRTEVDRTRTQLLVLSAVVSLGILAVFKYFNFFVDSLSSLTSSLGLGELSTAIDVVLPVGISFYTFQALSYAFDVYRRRIEPSHNVVDFATYVAFFPQLVAGPIERAQRLLPQITNRNRLKPQGAPLQGALLLILQGLFKKVVLADGVAVVANDVFGNPDEYSWIGAILGVVAFGIQIYGDFSGYTDIARGVSRLFGIELVVNFKQPYLSRNITEFWRRWHISLSDWLRDYLYIPLGGNRGRLVSTIRNLMLTMLLGGLWHGASWNFVLWGGLHGAFLVVHRLTRGGGVSDRGLRWSDIPSIVLTFGLVHMAWVFFRADTFTDAFTVLERIVTFAGGTTPVADLALVAVLGAVTLGVDLFTRTQPDPLRILQRFPVLAGAGVTAAIAAIVVFSGGIPAPFIYFQF
ncbi:MAG: MBOAT family protein [Actinobacteria bacterium]|nr:MBOAT family protein [Actinomycetota bacterium]MBU1494160.1 MBOAT family protein [Actinomycetota bacterium]MBU1866717.1 MBOAT family protein [Actinomycetota bacterium]